MRELDRERAKMEQQEKKIIADIKKMAKAGQMDAVKIMAKVSQIFKKIHLKNWETDRLLDLGPCAHARVRQEVHADARQHPGGEPQDPDPQEPELDGPGHEGRD